MSIRVAGPNDVGVIADFSERLFREDAGQRDPYADLGWPARESAGYFGKFLRSLENAVFLAESDTGPTGYLAARWVPAGSMRTVATAELESMFVAGHARGRGVGTELVREFVSWAETRDAGRLSVTAYAGNGPALRLYRSFGFTPRSITLDRDASTP